MNEDYKPNERIVDRAVAWWMKALRKPKFDIGARGSVAAVITEGMFGMLPNNSTDEVLAQFGVELKALLMEGIEKQYTSGERFRKFPKSLDVDYGPDEILAQAAEKAGLKTPFPTKTNMFVGQNYMQISAGYGADYLYHYPAKDGLWVVTTLRGSELDTEMLVDFVIREHSNGRVYDFARVEQ
jgi:hypothetical protein